MHGQDVDVNGPTDDELLVRSRLRPDALGLLYERHAGAVFRYLARRVGPNAADDLLGEVFVLAVESRVRYRPHESGSALPWLYGIGRNVVRAHLRRQRPSALIDPDTGVDWHAVDERVDSQAVRVRLRHVLEAMTPAEREAFLLVAWEGLSAPEAAEALGVTAIALRTRLTRARQRARSILNDSPLPVV
jgi:RNA polymerase sigma-70 factor (ECF subfamily)